MYGNLKFKKKDERFINRAPHNMVIWRMSDDFFHFLMRIMKNSQEIATQLSRISTSTHSTTKQNIFLGFMVPKLFLGMKLCPMHICGRGVGNQKIAVLKKTHFPYWYIIVESVLRNVGGFGLCYAATLQPLIKPYYSVKK